jgi:hypothetical protein
LKGRSDREPPAAFCVFRVGTSGETPDNIDRFHATRLVILNGIGAKEV